MIDYLYYVKNMIKDANIERKEFLMSKIESHISQWLHYKNCKGRSPLHPEEFVSGNVHNFYFPTNESIQLVWDIDKIYRKSIAIQPKEFELPELQEIIKKDIDKLRDIEAEIEILKGEEFRKDINKLNLTPEEYEKFRLCLADKANLLDVINRMAEESQIQKEGVKPLYE